MAYRDFNRAIPTYITGPYPMSGSSLPIPKSDLSTTVPVGSAASGGEMERQRLYGQVTKLFQNFGYVNDEIFFMKNCVFGNMVNVGDRVGVEATFQPNMPIKWNAERVWLVENKGSSVGGGATEGAGSSWTGSQHTSGGDNARHHASPKYSSKPEKSRNNRSSPPRRKRRSQSGSPERRQARDTAPTPKEKPQSSKPTETSSTGGRSRKEPSVTSDPAARARPASPPGQRKVKSIMLNMKEMAINHLQQRYKSRLYVPSDFFHIDLRWQEVFPLHQPMRLGFQTDFQVFHRDVDPLDAQVKQLVTSTVDPPDADYTYTAKVMLLACPTLQDLYAKTCRLAEEPLETASYKQPFHRLFHFLVGTKGGKEPMAIGGPWSPSLDGPNPEEDAKVLLNTAIRTCRALTGIDLSRCVQWYRFLELHYYRPGDRPGNKEKKHLRRTETGTSGEGAVAGTPVGITASNVSSSSSSKPPREAKVETVVIFIPDIWSCMPSQARWGELKRDYEAALQARLNPAPPRPPRPATPPPPAADPVPAPANDETPTDGSEMEQAGANDTATAAGASETAEEEMDEGNAEPSTQKEPTHHSKLDVKTLKLAELRNELALRKLNSKGLKAQLMARLKTALDEEAKLDPTSKSEADKSKKPEEKVSTIVKTDLKAPPPEEARRLERHYRMLDTPAILVHPNRVTRSGLFDCECMSLQALLNYTPEDQKEHTFEVSLFAEQFSEMLQRDAAFSIYKAIVVAPERTEEEGKEAAAAADKTKAKPGDTKPVDTKDEPDTKKRKVEPSIAKPATRKAETPAITSKKVRKTTDLPLLFAFTLFDPKNSGYMDDVDMETIIQSLGLNLSRTQMRSLVGKVYTFRRLYYRNLTDKLVDPRDTDSMQTTSELDDVDYIVELALGNNALFDEDSVPQPARVVMVHSGDGTGNQHGKEGQGDESTPSAGAGDGNASFLVRKLERAESYQQELQVYISRLKGEFEQLRKEFDRTARSESGLKKECHQLQTELRAERKSVGDSRLALNTLLRDVQVGHAQLMDVQKFFYDSISRAKRVDANKRESASGSADASKSAASSKTSTTTEKKEKQAVLKSDAVPKSGAVSKSEPVSKSDAVPKSEPVSKSDAPSPDAGKPTELAVKVEEPAVQPIETDQLEEVHAGSSASPEVNGDQPEATDVETVLEPSVEAAAEDDNEEDEQAESTKDNVEETVITVDADIKMDE